MRLPDTLIHVEIDPEEIDRNYAATLGVVGDARAALQLIDGQLRDVRREDDSIAAEIATLRQKVWRYCQERAPEGVELVQTLRKAMPRETILVSDLTVAAYWCRRMLDIYEPRTNIYPWGFCTLGFGLPAAIGAKVARPDRPVVVLCGDGGFMFNCQELAAAVQFDVPISHTGLQRRGLRCPAATAGGPLRRRARGGRGESGLHGTGGGVRCGRLPSRIDRAAWAGSDKGDRSGQKCFDRVAGIAAVANHGAIGAHF